MVKILLAVAAGGALGAVGRYLVITAVGQIFGTGFPLGTIVVNVVGSFVLGALTEVLALVWSPSPELRAMIVVGVLGAFTTFSTFSLDVALLYERGALGQAALYVGASVILSIGGFFLGLALLRSLLA
ncbi:MAG: fluoride efflux transporter CrcB [Kiloniellales bacterium]|nr:fluoride efflux transporter CrcB [Kiloniellales bacterium]